MKIHICLLLVGTLIGLINLRQDTDAGTEGGSQFADWPNEFEGRPIGPVALSETEAAFADSFPGAIGVFESSGGRQVILRRADRPTRRLHDSATCLRAAGFAIGDRQLHDGWLCYRASRAGIALDVREQIVAESGESKWTDVSRWFWEALFHKGGGPWTAITVLDPILN